MMQRNKIAQVLILILIIFILIILSFSQTIWFYTNPCNKDSELLYF